MDDLILIIDGIEDKDQYIEWQALLIKFFNAEILQESLVADLDAANSINQQLVFFNEIFQSLSADKLVIEVGNRIAQLTTKKELRPDLKSRQAWMISHIKELLGNEIKINAKDFCSLRRCADKVELEALLACIELENDELADMVKNREEDFEKQIEALSRLMQQRGLPESVIANLSIKLDLIKELLNEVNQSEYEVRQTDRIYAWLLKFFPILRTECKSYRLTQCEPKSSAPGLFKAVAKLPVIAELDEDVEAEPEAVAKFATFGETD